MPKLNFNKLALRKVLRKIQKSDENCEFEKEPIFILVRASLLNKVACIGSHYDTPFVLVGKLILSRKTEIED